MRRRLAGGSAALSVLVLLPAGAFAQPVSLSAPPPFSPPASVGRGEVTIPASEYRALLESSGNGASTAALPGVRVENARFRVSVTETAESAAFEERFDLRVSGSGWTSLAVGKSPLDRASLAPAERGAFFTARDVTRLALNGPGTATATLGATVPVGVDSNGRRHFSLTMPLLAVQQGKIELPRDSAATSAPSPCATSATPSRSRSATTVTAWAATAPATA